MRVFFCYSKNAMAKTRHNFLQSPDSFAEFFAFTQRFKSLFLHSFTPITTDD